MAKRTVVKSATTGKFVTTRTERRNPSGTVRQTVGGKATGYRSAKTGRFVTKSAATRNPGGTIQE